MLPLYQALELYSLLREFLPEDSNTPAVDYVRNIMQNMGEQGGESAYVQAAELMGVDTDQDAITVMADFVEGLSANEILALKDMVERMGL